MQKRHASRAALAALLSSMLVLASVPARAEVSSEPASTERPAQAASPVAGTALSPSSAAAETGTRESVPAKSLGEMLRPAREDWTVRADDSQPPILMAPAAAHGHRTAWIVVACIVGAAVVIAVASNGGNNHNGGGGGGGY